MKVSELLLAWQRILSGKKPSLSIEITRECPLRCPGCYAYGDSHLGEGATNLRNLSDFKGQELVTRVLAVVDAHKPLHLSIVGGDPLVRYRELELLLPQLTERGVHTQVVTSAFRTIPVEWQKNKKLNVVVSVDGLAAEHDLRRRPATYERILKSIEGHQHSISIHCTITAHMVRRSGYLKDFAELWSARPEVKRIWFSMYTPQVGEVSNEIIPWADREKTVAALLKIAEQYPLVDMPQGAIRNFLTPPKSPDKCTFARTTETISADLKSRVTPCQFGGNPDCSQCGCIASVALEAVSKHKVAGTVRAGTIMEGSLRIGQIVQGLRPAQPSKADPLPILKQTG
jgi:MoaA/NifB/PqqE/SkfB family radical SAM enzyme